MKKTLVVSIILLLSSCSGVNVKVNRFHAPEFKTTNQKYYILNETQINDLEFNHNIIRNNSKDFKEAGLKSAESVDEASLIVKIEYKKPIIGTFKGMELNKSTDKDKRFLEPSLISDSGFFNKSNYPQIEIHIFDKLKNKEVFYARAINEDTKNKLNDILSHLVKAIFRDLNSESNYYEMNGDINFYN